MLRQPILEVNLPEAAVTHLPRTFSNHCLVLIKLCRTGTPPQNKPFCFHTMWFLHPEFLKIVQDAWLKDRELQVVVLDFASKAKQWNYNIFGNIFAKKRRVLARINGTQKALANNPNDFLLTLEQ